jgi:hypothetical protein
MAPWRLGALYPSAAPAASAPSRSSWAASHRRLCGWSAANSAQGKGDQHAAMCAHITGTHRIQHALLGMHKAVDPVSVMPVATRRVSAGATFNLPKSASLQQHPTTQMHFAAVRGRVWENVSVVCANHHDAQVYLGSFHALQAQLQAVLAVSGLQPQQLRPLALQQRRRHQAQ